MPDACFLYLAIFKKAHPKLCRGIAPFLGGLVRFCEDMLQIVFGRMASAHDTGWRE